MLYQTILLELIQSRPQLHERLKQQRAVKATVERLALDLKARHLFWQDSLHQTNPDLDPIQIQSMAGELALQEIEPLLEIDKTDESLPLNGTKTVLNPPSSHE